jgi:hypothetical protein
MCVEVDETHCTKSPSTRETVASPGVGGIYDVVANRRSFRESFSAGDVCVFTGISYPGRLALSKRSETPYVVILLRVTCESDYSAGDNLRAWNHGVGVEVSRCNP